MTKSTKIMAVIAIIIIIALCLAACNKTVFDTKYKFEKAHIRVNDVWFDVDVDKWCDYDGEYECDECGKGFYFQADIEVTYSTQRKES